MSLLGRVYATEITIAWMSTYFDSFGFVVTFPHCPQICTMGSRHITCAEARATQRASAKQILRAGGRKNKCYPFMIDLDPQAEPH